MNREIYTFFDWYNCYIYFLQVKTWSCIDLRVVRSAYDSVLPIYHGIVTQNQILLLQNKFIDNFSHTTSVINIFKCFWKKRMSPPIPPFPIYAISLGWEVSNMVCIIIFKLCSIARTLSLTLHVNVPTYISKWSQLGFGLRDLAEFCALHILLFNWTNWPKHFEIQSFLGEL